MITARLKLITTSFICLFLTLIFTGCSHKSKQAPLKPESFRTSLAAEIRDNGVQIVQQGSRLQFILPTDKFFRLQTTEVKQNKIRILKLIAIYIKQFLATHHSNNIITVKGYTDTVFLKHKRYELSKKYAEVVASYLWNQGFSHQQLQVYGEGSTHIVGNPKTSAGSGDNRRVVIQVN